MTAAGTTGLQRMTMAVGAVIEDIDMRQPLAPAQHAFIRQALLDHGVVFFRGQDIDLEQFWAFMQHFGQPQKEESRGTDHDRPDEVQTNDMSPTRHATATWHADTTSLAKPPIATALRCVSRPPFGGDTCWSSMHAAWEALSPPMKRMLDGLTAVHSIAPTMVRMAGYSEAFKAGYADRHAYEQIHPVVLTHPESGKKVLYVSETFTTRIIELAPRESAAVLAMLFRHVESPDFTMRWKWSANDIAFWDNRSVQHYAVPDYSTARVMQRIVLAGERPGEPSSLTARHHALAVQPAAR